MIYSIRNFSTAFSSITLLHLSRRRFADSSDHIGWNFFYFVENGPNLMESVLVVIYKSTKVAIGDASKRAFCQEWTYIYVFGLTIDSINSLEYLEAMGKSAKLLLNGSSN
jgi:hypothetical protein